MKDVPYYNGRAGIINKAYVNPFDEVELEGTWGGLIVLPHLDEIKIIN